MKFLDTGRVEITSQNHGFAVDPDSLPHSPERFLDSKFLDEQALDLIRALLAEINRAQRHLPHVAVAALLAEFFHERIVTGTTADGYGVNGLPSGLAVKLRV